MWRRYSGPSNTSASRNPPTTSNMISQFMLGFLSDFFPDLSRFINQFLADLRLAEFSFSCRNSEAPPLSLDLSPVLGHKLPLRNASLWPLQLLGAFIGLHGVSRHAARPALRAAMYWFAAMNLSSIFCHNVFPRHTANWEIARLLDVAATGASALNLAVVGFDKLQPISSWIIFPIILLYNIIGDHRIGLMPMPWTAELSYFGTMIIGFLFLFPRLHTMGRGMRSIWYWLSLLGLQLAVFSLLLDSVLCFLSEDGDGIGKASGLLWLFGGCDLVFWALGRYFDA